AKLKTRVPLLATPLQQTASDLVDHFPAGIQPESRTPMPRRVLLPANLNMVTPPTSIEERSQSVWMSKERRVAVTTYTTRKLAGVKQSKQEETRSICL